MTLNARCLIGLVGLSIVDAIIPIPILGVILIYVVLNKPRWFHKVVKELYEG
jgi:hypothetical protein